MEIFLITVYAIYIASQIFHESGLQEWLNSLSRRRAMDGEIGIIHSFLELKAKLAILPCTCTVYCTTSIAYTSRIHASRSEVNIFVCCYIRE